MDNFKAASRPPVAAAAWGKRGRALAALSLAVLLMLLAGSAYTGPAGFDGLIKSKGPAVIEVMESPTLFRVAELPGLPCSAEAFEFFLDRPRISIALARIEDPEVDDYEIVVMPDGSFHVDDGGRLVGDMELVEKSDGSRTYYISGYWRFMLGMRFEGRMVLVPKFCERPPVFGSGPVVDASASGYMKVDNVVAGFMAKVVTYLFPGKVDRRMERFARAVRKVAQSVHDDPGGAYERLKASGKMTEDELRAYREMFLKGYSGSKV